MQELQHTISESKSALSVVSLPRCCTDMREIILANFARHVFCGRAGHTHPTRNMAKLMGGRPGRHQPATYHRAVDKSGPLRSDLDAPWHLSYKRG